MFKKFTNCKLYIYKLCNTSVKIQKCIQQVYITCKTIVSHVASDMYTTSFHSCNCAVFNCKIFNIKFFLQYSNFCCTIDIEFRLILDKLHSPTIKLLLIIASTIVILAAHCGQLLGGGVVNGVPSVRIKRLGI